MPEPLTIDPLFTPAPGTSSQGGGIDSMMAQLDAAEASGGDVAPDPAPAPAPAEPKPDPTDPEPPEAAPAPEPAPVKPDVAKDEMSDEDKEKFLKLHSNKKPWKIYESLKTTTAGKVAELEAKLKTIEGKSIESPGDAAKVAALEKQIEALTGETTNYKQKLAETEFTHTPQYQNIRQRGSQLVAKASTLVEGMKFTTRDGTVRQASKADFDYIRAVPAAERADVAAAHFGDLNAYRVLNLAEQIDDIIQESNIAAEEFAKTHEQSAAQREQAQKAHVAKYGATVKAEMDNLRKDPKNGRWFSPDEKDPEIAKVLNESFAKVDEIINGSANATLEQAAANSALLRSQAAAFPRVVMENGRLDAKVKALEAELAKIRGTDPGARGAAAPAAAAAPRRGGIEEASAAFDSDPSIFNGRR